MMEARCLITPHMVACEFQMVLARELRVCPLDGEMQFIHQYSVGLDAMGVRIWTLGYEVTVYVDPRELTLNLDDFSWRHIVPMVIELLEMQRGSDGQDR
jgi:hypothetical protein